MRGIYAITNKITGRQYIGCSGNIKKRWEGHRRDLRRGKHHSRYLQNSWNKHGGGLFSFSVVALALPEADLVDLEKEVIADRQPKYNSMRPCHDNGGWEHRGETKQAQSQRAKSLWEDPGYVEKQRQAIAPIHEAQRKKWEPYRLAKKSLRRLAYLKWWVENCCLHYDGRLQTRAQWAEELGISRETLNNRLKRANGNLHYALGPYRTSLKRCLYPKPLPKPPKQTMLTYDGKTQSLGAWADETGVSKSTIVARLNRGWSIEQALNLRPSPPGGRKAQTYEFEGAQRTISEIAELVGASTTTIRTAIEEGRDPRYRKRGDRLEKRGPKATYYEVDGESKTLKEWAEELGVKEARMRYVVRDRGEGAHAAVERFVRDMRVVKKLTEKSA